VGSHAPRSLKLLTRRQLIKIGFAGAALLATARLLGPARAASATPYRVLDEPSAKMIAALVPVVLAGSLPADAAAQAAATRDVLVAFDRAVSGLAPAVQAEIGELFGFLHFAPTRLAFARLWAPLEESTPEEIHAFLTRWRHSRLALQRVSYQALTQLIQASWYDNPASWEAIRYPGPPMLNPLPRERENSK
jgi:hypothetical protein